MCITLHRKKAIYVDLNPALSPRPAPDISTSACTQPWSLVETLQVSSLPILLPRTRLGGLRYSGRHPHLSSERALCVLSQSPAVETSSSTQPRLFSHSQLPTLGESAFTAELSHAARACTLRPTRSRRALKYERGHLC
jgi:hypothetical protein